MLGSSAKHRYGAAMAMLMLRHQIVVYPGHGLVKNAGRQPARDFDERDKLQYFAAAALAARCAPMAKASFRRATAAASKWRPASMPAAT